MNRTILMAGAILIAASCASAADPKGPMGCCSADFDAENPQAGELVQVRVIPDDERLWNQPDDKARREKWCAEHPEEKRLWC